jgi:pimeloyl-ACP methyl ester carboxylesterase
LKLVLLPGMDGTGHLFAPLLHSIPEFDCQIIPLPEEGNQCYPSITEWVKDKLPEENFILIAESFSGPIGLELAKAQPDNLKGIIFVATFLSPPNKLLTTLARFLPLKLMSRLPFSSYVLKRLFLGSGASNELVDLFRSTINSLPPSLISARLNTISSLVFSPARLDLPVGYIQARSDKLIQKNKICEFKAKFKDILIKPIEGPHFILQAKPNECSEVIRELVSSFKRHTKDNL